MKIKYRLTLYFSLLVAGILVVFSISVYTFYLKHRQNDFLTRLKNKAINTVTLLNTEPFDIRLLKIIDHTSVTNMEDLTVVVLNSDNDFLYSNRDIDIVTKSMVVFKKLDWNKNSNFTLRNKMYLGFPYDLQNKRYYLLASAGDLYGKKELRKLLLIFLVVYFFSLGLIVIAGFVNARQSLKPIKDIIRQVDEIKGTNLNVVLRTMNKDEIAELASTFNKMLERIRQAFEREKFFVSNASHELRTPLTSIKGQIEVALIKKRTDLEYIKILASVLEDIENMTQMINGFLELAETNVDPSNIALQKIRVDELLFAVKDDNLKRNPSYTINIEFEKAPTVEGEISISGNYGLLWIMISNLVDNACKFSENKKVTIKIGFDNSLTIVDITDNGIGIPDEELEFITQPLYRAQNARKMRGHGLGLSIVQRIAEIHKAKVNFKSTLSMGTTVTIMFPK